jgi:glycosyltransferase involved in cell wall biosynthesis
VDHRLEVVSALPRIELLEKCRQCDAGLALMPLHANDINQRSMTGASNKVFDYMASGVPLIVSDLPDWRDAYVETGYGLACDPGDPQSITRGVRWLLDHAEDARRMGEEGRQRILKEWNYEVCFQPVLRCLRT